MRSLTSRLVLVAVALVAVVTLLVGGATVLAMRAYLTQQLDARVVSAAASLDRGPSAFGGRQADYGNLGPGALVVGFASTGQRAGVILGEGFDRDRPLTAGQVARVLATEPEDRSVRLPGVGGFRITSIGSGEQRAVVGLPTAEVEESVRRLITLAAALGTLGIGTAAAVGLLVVRRQLAPLREVAGTAHRVSQVPLASGEFDLSDRVPVRLTDEGTEVGQVGAALNTLLDHVETALEARYRSEQQVRRFVADASHELRTPLATITGYTELARRRPDDAASARLALDKVESESARMTALVEDLLLLARLDAGRPLGRHPVDLTRLLLEAVADARVLAPDRTWRLDLPDEVVEVMGDEQRLHQVVANLLTHARKYTPAGTTVTVTARPGVVTVHDDGPGFPPDVAPRAFERFVRGDAARTRSLGGVDAGAGLGLAIVQAIVQAHGGDVTLTSRPGDTTVTVRLPVSAPAAPSG